MSQLTRTFSRVVSILILALFFSAQVLLLDAAEINRLDERQQSLLSEILPPISHFKLQDSLIESQHSLSPRQWTPNIERAAAALIVATVEHQVSGDFQFENKLFSSLQRKSGSIRIRTTDLDPSSVQLIANVQNQLNAVNIIFEKDSQIKDVQVVSGGILFGPMNLFFKIMDWIKPGWGKATAIRWVYGILGVLLVENFLLGYILGSYFSWTFFVTLHLSNFLPYLSGSRSPPIKKATVALAASSIIALLNITLSLSPHDFWSYLIHASINIVILFADNQYVNQSDIDRYLERRPIYKLEMKGNAQPHSQGEVRIDYPDGSKAEFAYDNSGKRIFFREDSAGEITSHFIHPLAMARTYWPVWQKLKKLKDKKRSLSGRDFTTNFENKLAQVMDLPQDRVLIATRMGRYALAALYGLISTENTHKKIRIALPSFTFWATLLAKDLADEVFGELTTAKIGDRVEPVFIDINPKTLTMDLEHLEREIENVDVIMTVDMFGNLNDFKKVANLAREHGVVYFHDGAHTINGMWNGEHACAICDGSIVSLSFSKVFTGGQYGKGGVLILPNDAATRLSLIPNWKKIRMTNESAISLLTNISDIEGNIKVRTEYAQLYRDGLSPLPGIDFQEISPDVQNPNRSHFVIKVDPKTFGGSSQDLIHALKERSIEAKIYFEPLHTHHHELKASLSLPHTEEMFKKVVALPFSHTMTKGDITDIVHSIHDIWRKWNSQSTPPEHLSLKTDLEPPRYIHEWVEAILVPAVLKTGSSLTSKALIQEELKKNQFSDYPFVASYNGMDFVDLITINQISHINKETFIVFQINEIPHQDSEFHLKILHDRPTQDLRSLANDKIKPRNNRIKGIRNPGIRTGSKGDTLD